MAPLLAPVAVVGHRPGLSVRQSRRVEDWLFGESIYGPIGIVVGSGVLDLSPCPVILITACPPPMPGCTKRRVAGRQPLADLHHRDAAGRALWPDQRDLRGVYPGHHRLWRAQGDRRAIQHMRATDIYKQVVGQQNFQMGAVVSLVLLLPAVVAFFVERWGADPAEFRRVQPCGALSSQARSARDLVLLGLVSVVAAMILGILGMAAFASLAKLWPYNLSLTLSHYDFSSADGGSWASYGNSIRLALYGVLREHDCFCRGLSGGEKAPSQPLRTATHLLALIPMAVPGMVLGLAYIFFQCAR